MNQNHKNNYNKMTTPELFKGSKHMSDPTVIGPGTWYVLHTMAANVSSLNDLHEAIKSFSVLIDNFKCMNCRGHAQKYKSEHNLVGVIHCKHKDHVGGIEMCLFKWSVDFHNFVNARLNKPIVNYLDAYPYYKDSQYDVCESDCGHHDDTATVAASRVVSAPSITRGPVPGKYGFHSKLF